MKAPFESFDRISAIINRSKLSIAVFYRAGKFMARQDADCSHNGFKYLVGVYDSNSTTYSDHYLMDDLKWAEKNFN